MEYLWAPWRATYLTDKNRDENGCIFCRAAENPSDDVQNLVVHRAAQSFVIINRYPYTSGHLMIVPYRHVSTLTDASEASTSEMMHLARLSERVINDVYHPGGLNMGLNIGAAAGAGIAAHIHLHVLPRWLGDANFMTSVGQTRVLPESLETTFEKIQAAFTKAN